MRSPEGTRTQDLTLSVIDDTIRRGKTGVVEMHDPLWRLARGFGAFISQGGQGLRCSDVGSSKGECQGRRWGQNLNLYKHCPTPICEVRGLGFPFGKIGGSESIVLWTGLRDIRSSNQYKLIRAS